MLLTIPFFGKKTPPTDIDNAIAVLEQAKKALKYLPDTLPGPAWHSGIKTYLVAAVSIALSGLGIYSKTISLPDGIAAILVALTSMTYRSALKTHAASVVNALVNPESPAAIVTAATVPQPSIAEQVKADLHKAV
jgi:hypothetical protein